MGYDECIEAAGTKVLAYIDIGGYTGEWFALTVLGFYRGTYGSCSGCDWREHEQFGIGWDESEAKRKQLAHDIDAGIGRKILNAKPMSFDEFKASCLDIDDGYPNEEGDRDKVIAWARDAVNKLSVE